MRRVGYLLCLVLLALSTVIPAQAVGKGSFFTRCDFVKFKQIDPIVSPGVRPSAHMHQFFGANAIKKGTVPADLASMGTTCSTTDDKSGYWIPALVKSDGTYVSAPNMNAYYVIGDYQVRTFPVGTQLIGTQATYTCGTGKFVDLSAGRKPFSCAGLGPAVNGNNGVMPRIIVTFPNCVKSDGSIVYGSTGCAYRVPQVQEDIRFEGFTSIGGYALSSGAWSTMHADFMFGWNSTRFQSLVTNCLNAHVVCASRIT